MILQNLNGCWDLYFHPEKGGKSASFSPNMLTYFTKIPAQVPGNVQLDLCQSGIEPDPFFGDNLHKYAPYEYYQWIYSRSFTVNAIPDDQRLILSFGGIDTIADVYLNGQHIGRAENMFIEHEYDITDAVKFDKENQLIVHIHSAMNFARSKTYDMGMRGTAHRNEICWIRKAPHCFGWDIAPRFVTAGLWRDVCLKTQSSTRITETYYATPALSADGIYLQYGCRFVTDHDTLDDFTIRIHGICGEHAFEETVPAHFVSMNYTTLIKNPKLWWPLGYGDQNLYEITMELRYKDQVIDSRSERIGLRTLRLERDFAPNDQKFQIYVNEKKFFAKGTNWVPLDAFHSRDAEQLQKAHNLVVECGCNIMRCWGGNVYEDHAFFDLCDEKGILIWQDFAMGNTNYPQTPDFAAVIEDEIRSFVRKVRNHPSIAFWCSDNEIDYKNEGFQLPCRDSSYNRIAYELLPRLIQAHDPYRILIKSSPEIPEGFNMYNVPEQHRWGARAWYKDDFYLKHTAKFISEYGFHGCPAPSSIRKYIPKDHVWPLDNDYWAVHSTEDVRIERSNGRNEMMREHVKIMYGTVPDDLEAFAVLSQLYQAEALKTMIEHCRSLEDFSGLIWWNMLDCWPQISDSVTDYYFKRKLAYFYIKRCQKPLLVFMGQLSSWYHPVYISNHALEPADVHVTISDGDTNEVLLDGVYHAEAGETVKIADIRALVSDQKLLLIRYESNGENYGNHFITGTPAYKAEDMLRWYEKIRNLPDSFEYEP